MAAACCVCVSRAKGARDAHGPEQGSITVRIEGGDLIGQTPQARPVIGRDARRARARNHGVRRTSAGFAPTTAATLGPVGCRHRVTGPRPGGAAEPDVAPSASRQGATSPCASQATTGSAVIGHYAGQALIWASICCIREISMLWSAMTSRANRSLSGSNPPPRA
jgi:hypothetical protein